MLNRFSWLMASVFSFECYFVAYLYAGRFKGDERLSWLPVDLTAAFFLLSILAACWVLLKSRPLSKDILLPLALVLLFFVYVGVSIGWSPGHSYSVSKTSYLLTLTAWCVLAPLIVVSSDMHRLKRLLAYLLLFSIVSSIEAVIVYLKGVVGFLTIFGSNYLALGRTLGVGMAIAIALGYRYFCRKDFNSFSLWMGVAGVFVLLMLLSGGRGPTLSALISLVVFFAIILFSKRGFLVRNRWKSFYMAFSVLFVVGLIGILVVFSEEMFQTVFRIGVIFTQDDMGSSVAARVEHFGQALVRFSESPIWGKGIGGYAAANEGRAYPHNIILELLVETGLLGCVLFLVVLAVALRCILIEAVLRADWYVWAVLMILVQGIFNSMFSGDFNDNRMLFMPMSLCFVVYMIHKKIRISN
ncbi:O-antigen ligase family protein [Endozoicomonas numazuensis]|uniref:O-antigen ligase-related domain-containing protein n=1 Tax=Endozoicomonas numazuensis TaxID=1137799 RepID=A0A081N3R1_9GAMM|nr:O-antigen ligase family protein [Endozoicomonas numazuensis]KEQ13084.1 hypothetical protein GZ78_26370 [Endozoicomonas numazuensis]